MSRVSAQAIVDIADDGYYKVTVTGQPPYSHQKEYILRSDCEDAAAFAGIELFCAEMLQSNEGETCH